MKNLVLKFIFRFKKTYTYYYYLCFKDFFKKLLKPKRMKIIKWRISSDHDFHFYTEIPSELFFKSSPIYYQDEFNIDNKLFEIEIEKYNLLSRKESVIIKPVEFFRFISNNSSLDYIFTKNKKYIKEIIDCKILSIIENKSKIQKFDINTLSNNKYFAIMSFEENSVVFINNNNKDLISIEDNINGLKRIELYDFFKRFKIY